MFWAGVFSGEACHGGRGCFVRAGLRLRQNADGACAPCLTSEGQEEPQCEMLLSRLPCVDSQPVSVCRGAAHPPAHAHPRCRNARSPRERASGKGRPQYTDSPPSGRTATDRFPQKRDVYAQPTGKRPHTRRRRVGVQDVSASSTVLGERSELVGGVETNGAPSTTSVRHRN